MKIENINNILTGGKDATGRKSKSLTQSLMNAVGLTGNNTNNTTIKGKYGYTTGQRVSTGSNKTKQQTTSNGSSGYYKRNPGYYTRGTDRVIYKNGTKSDMYKGDYGTSSQGSSTPTTTTTTTVNIPGSTNGIRNTGFTNRNGNRRSRNNLQQNQGSMRNGNLQLTANNLRGINETNKNSKNNNKDMSKNNNKNNNSTKNELLPAIGDIKESAKSYLFSSKIFYTIFYILVLTLLFVILYYFGKKLIYKYVYKQVSINLLSGVKSATKAYVISQDPVSHSYLPIKRSDDGLQFTYSAWMYIESLDSNKDRQHIFHKGNSEANPLMCPAVYLEGGNTIGVHINTLKNIDETVKITNIPLRKWLCLTIVVNERMLDIYINGYLKERKELTSLPKQNEGNFWCNMNGGFEGFMSNIKYYPYAVELNEIISEVENGPASSKCLDSGDEPPYFDRAWFSV